MATVGINISAVTPVSGNQGNRDFRLLSWVADKDACTVAHGFILTVKKLQRDANDRHQTVAVPCEHR